MNKLKQWLYRRADNPRQNLVILGIGFVTFFIGLLILGAAEFAFKSSVSQEILGLIGLIILSVGIILAAIGYLSLSVLRIIRFISDDKHD
ncbi:MULTISPECIES: hypothetical protein [unclassified Neptuniibacter]|uniref:hypothetical protein n=1 Tax=unclassified Neptuniibacter TaxID=2630693 RepID=UPI000C4A262F|nr:MULTISPECIES: hypothetical protein [unclassified Neptuniibacter]MAY43252.1 hypothetical protein [Oceanospirillaceae bacterium]|tara:strand:- start:3404 stop:3673 length:270 start_codon:yes stop_codon:yes gene_type:complete